MSFESLCRFRYRLQTNNGIDAPVSEALVYRVLKIESLQEVYTIVENMLKQMEQAILNSKNNRQAELLNEITKITRERYTEYSGLKRPGYRGSGTIVPQQ